MGEVRSNISARATGKFVRWDFAGMLLFAVLTAGAVAFLPWWFRGAHAGITIGTDTLAVCLDLLVLTFGGYFLVQSIRCPRTLEVDDVGVRMIVRGRVRADIPFTDVAEILAGRNGGSGGGYVTKNNRDSLGTAAWYRIKSTQGVRIDLDCEYRHYSQLKAILAAKIDPQFVPPEWKD